jgi:acetate kinase
VRVLALNAGSRSVKAQLLEVSPNSRPAAAADPLWSGERVYRDGNADTAGAVKALLADLGARSFDVAAHRIVQTAGVPRAPALPFDAALVADVAAARDLAPLHTRAVLAVKETFDAERPDAPQVGVFDSAFHRDLPARAACFAGPYAWYEAGLRKIGFHGLSYAYCAARAREELGAARSARVVAAHLGGGCSLAAIANGASIETTMGYTPLDGVAMVSRSGALDPGLVMYLLRSGRYSLDELDRTLNERSGVRGIAGGSGDLRDVRAAAEGGDARASLALEVFAYRIRCAVGALAAALGGLDALIFAGGIGEHDAATRADICAGLAHLGVALDAGRNAAGGDGARIDAAGAATAVLVLRTREEWIMALAARDCLAAGARAQESSAG